MKNDQFLMKILKMQRFEFIETQRYGEKRNNLKYKIPLWPDVKGPVRIELAYFGIFIFIKLYYLGKKVSIEPIKITQV